MATADNIAFVSAIAAGISAVVAMGALFVAWCARKDSKRSADAAQEANKLMAQQLELENTKHQRQIEAELQSSKPRFLWRGGMAAGDGTRFERDFQNVGGDVTSLKLNVDNTDVEAIVSPATIVQRNGLGKIAFESKSKRQLGDFTFTLECSTSVEPKFKQTFKANPKRSDNIYITEA